MYWRIRKYGPLDVAKKYGIHAALVASLLFNGLLLATRPNLKKKVTLNVKAQLEQFAQKVATHILDTSYITYGSDTASLMNTQTGELDLPVINALKQQQLLPNSIEELKANVQTYTEQRRVVAVRIDKVNTGDAVMVNGASLIPVDVWATTAVHSADEVSQPTQWHFRFLLGYRGGNTEAPLVADFKDLSG